MVWCRRRASPILDPVNLEEEVRNGSGALEMDCGMLAAPWPSDRLGAVRTRGLMHSSRRTVTTSAWCRAGVKVKHDFLLVNRLSEPITIVNLRPSCGCTSGRAHSSTVAPARRR